MFQANLMTITMIYIEGRKLVALTSTHRLSQMYMKEGAEREACRQIISNHRI
jgi:hypothetical protein